MTVYVVAVVAGAADEATAGAAVLVLLVLTEPEKVAASHVCSLCSGGVCVLKKRKLTLR